MATSLAKTKSMRVMSKRALSPKNVTAYFTKEHVKHLNILEITSTSEDLVRKITPVDRKKNEWNE
jgi:hypothetical protein